MPVKRLSVRRLRQMVGYDRLNRPWWADYISY